MEERDDEFLKELYNEARPQKGEEAPDFADMIDDAESASKDENSGGGRAWIGAVAAVILAAAMAFVSVVISGEETEEPTIRAEAVESVQQEAEEVASAQAVAEEEAWEELAQLADELWEEEYPTDFLLVAVEIEE